MENSDNRSIKVISLDRQQTALSMRWKHPVSLDREGRESVKDLMVICFDALDTYGKSPSQLANIVKLFLISLSDYPAPLIRRAFETWVRTQSKLPTPAEIIGLMQENNGKLLRYIERLRETGGEYGLTQQAYNELESQLGTDWRRYV